MSTNHISDSKYGLEPTRNAPHSGRVEIDEDEDEENANDQLLYIDGKAIVVKPPKGRRRRR